MATLTDEVLVLACEIQDEAARCVFEILFKWTGSTYSWPQTKKVFLDSNMFTVSLITGQQKVVT
jgi:hypothetical protein